MTPKENHLVLIIGHTSEDDPNELAQLTRQLHEEMMELDVDKVDYLVSTSEVPEGAKGGDVVAWGSLLLTLATSSGVLPALINSVQSWLTRHNHRSITLELGGDKLEVTGISSEEQQRLIDNWISRHHK